MGYKALIDRMVTKAFNLAGDTTTQATFNKKLNSAFNFGSGEVTSTAQNITTQVLEVEAKKSSSQRNVVKKTLLVKTSVIGDVTAYDTVTITGSVWKITGVPKNDGYTSIVEVTKEH